MGRCQGQVQPYWRASFRSSQPAPMPHSTWWTKSHIQPRRPIIGPSTTVIPTAMHTQLRAMVGPRRKRGLGALGTRACYRADR